MNLDFGNTNNNNGQHTSLNLSKNMSLDLSKHENLKHLRVGLGWEAGRSGENFDLDASALLLGISGRVNDNHDVIFYNQPDTGRGVVHQGDNRTGSTGVNDDEQITIDLDKVPANVNSIKIIVSIDKARERNQNFGRVNKAYIRLMNDDSGEEKCMYTLNENFEIQTSCEIAELKRCGNNWEFKALGVGYAEELEQVLIRHGVN